MPEQVVEILRNIITRKKQRSILIHAFQQRVWHGEKFSDNEMVQNLLSELAYDLDYYEPNPALRSEDSSFYGDERLAAELRQALLKFELFTTGRIRVSLLEGFMKWLRTRIGDKHCPVCSFHFDFLPWDGESPSYEICPSCGIQFGYSDVAGGGDVVQRKELYRLWHAKWIENQRRPIKHL